MIVAFIPARGGSKGISRKNVKELGGKPLIAWTIEAALKAKLDRVIVSTEDKEIKKIAKQYGAEVLDRPEELAQDDTPMFVLLDKEVPRIEPIPEMVVLLQPTVPFRRVMHIKAAVNTLAKNEDYDSILTAEKVPVKYSPDQVLVTTPTGLKMATGSPISQRTKSRQRYADAWIPTGSVYVFRTKNLEEGSFYGDRILALETEAEINIDDEADWKQAEKWLKN